MKNIVGVKFKKEGKIYSFHAADLPLKQDDLVVVSTENGPAVGTVVKEVQAVPAEQLAANLKNVIRMASDEDLTTCENNRRMEREAMQFCTQRIAERQLPMKLIDVECLFDQTKMVFYFTAENRVDFRDLVKDLVQKFRTRIELRQIGARQEARIIKGLGICGREVCCATLLQSLDRVSVKMAKEQNMSLNPEKISGLCGRLMCCLGYEYDGYVDMKKDMPKCGKLAQTPEGRGKVIRQSALRGEVVVFLESGKEATFKVSEIQRTTDCRCTDQRDVHQAGGGPRKGHEKPPSLGKGIKE